MIITVFTDSKTIKNFFSKMIKSDFYTIHFIPVKDIRKSLKNLNTCDLSYLDLSGLPDAAVSKFLKLIFSSTISQRFGIIDTEGKIKKISSLFHNGIIDYIGHEDIAFGYNEERINEILNFKECKPDISLYDDVSVNADYITAKNGWDDIIEGEEYTFAILYIRLDRLDEINKKNGIGFVNELTSRFQQNAVNEFGAIDGRIWKWDQNKGVILFPFNGQDCSAIMSCFKLIRDRIIFSAEIYKSPVIMDYSMILHLGNLVYKPESKSGTVVSDSINFIFHASEFLIPQSRLYITDSLFPFIPKHLSDLFVDVKPFEGRSLKSMKILKY